MKDSRVGIIDVRAVRAIRGRVLKLLDNLFLIAFSMERLTKNLGMFKFQILQWSSICLAVFFLRGWYRTFYESSL